MSHENVEIAKQAMDVYNRRDFGAIDDLFTLRSAFERLDGVGLK